MSWLSEFLGGKKIKTPKLKPLEEFAPGKDYEDSYLKALMRKSGYEKTIITGRKKPYLGAI